jgi:hypothetical protein
MQIYSSASCATIMKTDCRSSTSSNRSPSQKKHLVMFAISLRFYVSLFSVLGCFTPIPDFCKSREAVGKEESPNKKSFAYRIAHTSREKPVESLFDPPPPLVSQNQEQKDKHKLLANDGNCLVNIHQRRRNCHSWERKSHSVIVSNATQVIMVTHRCPQAAISMLAPFKSLRSCYTGDKC